MKYGYARVSTYGQAKDGNSLESQVKQLSNEGVSLENLYIDKYTGTKASRPNFDELLKKLQSGDTLVVTKLDRFSRSAVQGLNLINSLLDKGIRVHILNMGLMDNTPQSSLIRTIFLAFAEFERDLIVERTQEGKRIAKENNPNFKEGRPRKYSQKQIEYEIKLRNEGTSYKEIQKLIGISKATLCRYMKKDQRV